MPCLNEAETIESCIRKARRALDEHRIAGEIIVADNGSTDGSVEIAERAGARVVRVAEKGYGSALMGGIAAARGRYVLMGDADDSYDFGALPDFVAKLRAGFELVQGCRRPTGGGRILPGAMPFLHRWWGNPMFSMLARWWFRAPINDVHCGLRAFTRDLYTRLELCCTGMEFASEMVVKATLMRSHVTEVPITLHPDGRQSHAPHLHTSGMEFASEMVIASALQNYVIAEVPTTLRKDSRSRPSHLRTWSDGWRHLRFMLMFSPRWLFLVPGALLICLGALGYALAMPGVHIGRVHLDVHTLLFASLSIICGYQAVIFAILTKAFATAEGLLPPDRRVTRFFELVTLERGLLAGAVATIAGFTLLGGAVVQWIAANLGPLNYERTMRWVIPGVTCSALGVQTILSSFFASILGMRRR